MKILKAKVEDLSAINSYLKEMRMTPLDNASLNFEARQTYVIKDNKKIVGFICYLVLIENIELEAIYVSPLLRGLGYGTRLLKYLINEGIQFNCNCIFLEVRKSNVEAIHLYQKNDFEIIGCRKNYYGLEDGLVMKKELRCKNE